MWSLMQHVRYACRGLVRSPGFALTVIVTLALGTGANAAIFSIVDSVLLRPLPYHDPGRLVAISETNESDPAGATPSAVADVADWREQNRVFVDIAAYHPWSFTITGQGDAERVPGGVVTANLFSLLGVAPSLGRDFRPNEQGPAAELVAVLGNSFWRRRFGADPQVLGAKLTLNDKVYTIVGVMPAGFEFPDLAEIWVPITHGRDLDHRDFQFLRVVARMMPGVTAPAAQRDLAAVAARLAKQFPATNSGRGVKVVPLREQLAGELRPAMLLLSGTVLLILGIACTNVVSLSLARAAVRREELALRSALGAGRPRLVLQQVVESLILALAGGLLGLVLAVAGVRFLTAMAQGVLPRYAAPAVDVRVLAYLLLVSVVAGVVVGVLPALQASRPAVLELLKAAAGRQRGGGTGVRGGLVALEVAMALVLLVGAGLLVQSFARLRGVDPGFTTTSHALTAQLTLPEDRYPGLPQVNGFVTQLLERLDHISGTSASTAGVALPLAKGMSIDVEFSIDGQPAPKSEHKVAYLRPVMPNYFKVMGLPVYAGRPFLATEDENAAPVVIVNRTLANRYFPHGGVVGKRLTVGSDLGDLGSAKTESREIVGVVGDVKHAGLDADAQPEIYVSMRQTPWRLVMLVVRSTLPPPVLTRMVSSRVWALDRNLPLYRVRSMDEIVNNATVRPALYSTLVGGFAGIALLLAAVGIYGLLSYLVNDRMREIGVRMALGAPRRDIVRMVLVWVMTLTVTGIVLGLAASLALSRLLRTLLFGVSGKDVPTMLGATVVFGLLALLASLLPARRASRADPMTVLRVE